MIKKLGAVIVAGALAAAFIAAVSYADEAPPADDAQTATQPAPTAEQTEDAGGTATTSTAELESSEAK